MSVFGAADTELEQAKSDASSSNQAAHAPGSALPRLACRRCDEEIMA
jgi:hypothetical protein